jgi:hypothetical protein
MCTLLFQQYHGWTGKGAEGLSCRLAARQDEQTVYGRVRLWSVDFAHASERDAYHAATGLRAEIYVCSAAGGASDHEVPGGSDLPEA